MVCATCEKKLTKVRCRPGLLCWAAGCVALLRCVVHVCMGRDALAPLVQQPLPPALRATQVICPDTWKAGANNTNESGGRKVTPSQHHCPSTHPHSTARNRPPPHFRALSSARPTSCGADQREQGAEQGQAMGALRQARHPQQVQGVQEFAAPGGHLLPELRLPEGPVLHVRQAGESRGRVCVLPVLHVCECCRCSLCGQQVSHSRRPVLPCTPCAPMRPACLRSPGDGGLRCHDTRVTQVLDIKKYKQSCK